MAPGLLDCLSLAVCAIIHSVQLLNSGGSREGARAQGRARHYSHREVDIAGGGAGFLL